MEFELNDISATINSYRIHEKFVHSLYRYSCISHQFLGDELQVECTFDTTGNKHWVINGPGTEVANYSVK